MVFWIKLFFLFWEEMLIFFYRVVLGVEVFFWYVNSWYDVMLVWGVLFRVIFYDSIIFIVK